MKAIDDRADWFFVYIDEKDPSVKRLFKAVYEKKCRQLTKLAEEINEKLR